MATCQRHHVPERNIRPVSQPVLMMIFEKQKSELIQTKAKSFFSPTVCENHLRRQKKWLFAVFAQNLKMRPKS